MTLPCIEPKDLPGVLALPVHDDRRRHLETCLHCRAMVHAYEEFMDPEVGRAGFDVEAAEAELAGRLAGVLAVPRLTRRRFFGERAWFAAAAVLLVCASIFLARDTTLLRGTRLPEGSGVARGESEDPTQLAWVEDDDGWRLTWRADTPGTPLVVFLDANLEELARRMLATSGSARAAEVPAPAKAVYLQLVFEAEGDVVARSAVIAARPGGP